MDGGRNECMLQVPKVRRFTGVGRLAALAGWDKII